MSPDGRVVGESDWKAHVRMAADAEDRAFVASLMGRVTEPGQFANWIAPPRAASTSSRSTSSTSGSMTATPRRADADTRIPGRSPCEIARMT